MGFGLFKALFVEFIANYFYVWNFNWKFAVWIAIRQVGIPQIFFLVLIEVLHFQVWPKNAIGVGRHASIGFRSRCCICNQFLAICRIQIFDRCSNWRHFGYQVRILKFLSGDCFF